MRTTTYAVRATAVIAATLVVVVALDHLDEMSFAYVFWAFAGVAFSARGSSVLGQRD